jgi:hypothetical protein
MTTCTEKHHANHAHQHGPNYTHMAVVGQPQTRVGI